MKKNLIKVLKEAKKLNATPCRLMFNHACYAEVDCNKCPFKSVDNLDKIINELSK